MLKMKKNSDCEKRIVIVNLYHTVTVEYYVLCLSMAQCG